MFLQANIVQMRYTPDPDGYFEPVQKALLLL